jgi:RNA polymerase sigma factor (sigma-70 family)
MTSNPGQEPDLASWVRSAVASYQSPLLRYATSVCGDQERARDVVQETFLRLCRQRPADLDGCLGPWLYTVCRNQALDTRRKDGRMSTVSQSTLDARPDHGPDPAGTAEDRDQMSQVLAALAAMPPRQQEVLRLRFQGGLSYKEIASVTGHSVSNVGYLMHVGLRAMRSQLARSPTPPPGRGLTRGGS